MDRPQWPGGLIAQVHGFVFSWWGVILLLAIINLKSFPGIWTIRALYHMKSSFNGQLRQTVASPTAENAQRRVPKTPKTGATDTIDHHPLFQPEIISSHVSPAEIDFNMHKSNSTYFTDLDISRIKLVGRIMAPAWPLDRMHVEYKGRDGEMKRERVKGRPALALGATCTSFKREMKVLARYDVESRILGWDSRWLYIGSWFVSRKGGKGKKQLFASSLSKYIVKKGRITVRPEQFLTESGWIPPRPESTGNSKSLDSLQANGHGATENGKHDAKDTWTWEEIESHRLKGMTTVGGWADADLRLEQAYSS